jgi:hypothetical protein
VNGAYAVAPTRPSTFEDGIKSAPFTRAWAGVANQPTNWTEDPAVRFQAVVRLTALKLFAVELSVILASVAVEAFGVTVSEVAFVAVKATVAAFDVNPTCAIAVLLLPSTRTAAPVTAFLRRERIA